MTDGFQKWVLLSVLNLGACTAPRVEAPELPRSISPGWRLVNFSREKDVWRGTYSGGGVGASAAHVRVWPIHGQAEGLDRVQKWKPQANTVVFYGDRYFTAVDWSGLDREQAGTLVQALERAIK